MRKLFTVLFAVYLACIVWSTECLAATPDDDLSMPDDILMENAVTGVPEGLGIPSFYKKYVDADGIAVVSSGNVRDEALLRTATIIRQVLSKRKDVREVMVACGCRYMVIGEHEEVCDLPEYAHICNTPENTAFWNKRARGFGGSPEDDLSASCGEENVLCLPGDRYHGESIMVHEFAHIIHMVGIKAVNPDIDDELSRLLDDAKANGLWVDTYAVSNIHEYFAEGVQSFFNCNRHSDPPNGVHNHVNTRERLKEYDPGLYGLLAEYFPEIELSLCR